MQKSDSSGYGPLLNKGYKRRIIESRLLESLEDFGAVSIEGVKYCGKTWVGQAFADSELNLMDPSGNFQNLEVALLDPNTALEGAYPRLIDEWQEVPQLWDGVRNAVDRSNKKRTFILTGSSIPRKKNNEANDWKKPKHTGVGRIEKLRMRTMTLWEEGVSNGAVSLSRLFVGEKPSCDAPKMNLSSFSELAAKGGWPAFLDKSSERAQRVIRSYIREVCESDMSRVDDVRRDPRKVERLLHSLARNTEQATSNKTIIGDMTETSTESRLSVETVNDYLQALGRIFLLEEIPAWVPNLRSPMRINKRPKYHFVDPSIPVAILKTSAAALVDDLELFGFVFECMCMRDIQVYAQAMDAEVYYYRDQAGLEVDAVIESSDGNWSGIEIKLGHNKANEGASHLSSMAAKITRSGGKPPKFLAVVEGLGDYAYEREDGVYVIPICTLRP